MRLTIVTTACLFALSAAPAWSDEAPPKQDDQTIKVSPVGLPIVIDGRIVNYVFVSTAIDLTSSADVIALRDKEPELRDALVRDAHRTPFVLPGDYNHLDVAKLKAALYRDARVIVGAQWVKGVEVQNQTAQHFIRPPRPSPPVSP